jgi:alkanesulfonate monooxygenase SsuD/methylene tetrahydromethanopterin reductase-like flavin-dependent oxidoreductase (luciferase family)
VDSGRAEQRDHHLGGEAALPLHRAQHGDRGHQKDLGAGGPEYRGYLQRCHDAETEEKAMANAKQFMWMQGEFTGLAHPVWSSPSGYFSPSYRTAFVEYAVGRRSNPRGAAFEDQIHNQQIIAGTPKTVIPKLRRLLEETRPSIVGFWASDGFVSNEDTKTCIRLLGQEVLPALRDMGKELGLWSPFEANAATSINFPEPARLKAPAR